MFRSVSLILFLLTTSLHMQAQSSGQYAKINGLNLYYETHGTGQPLVLLHGGGSTIYTTYGRILPQLAKHHQVIALELQAHGHTADIDRPLSFEQDADDVAELLKHLNIAKADIMGFSNGGTTALQLAIRHPQLVNKMVIASSNFRRDGMPEGFFEMMKNATLDGMPAPLQDAFRKINPDSNALRVMFERDVARMLSFKDIPDSSIASINAPVLVINGDADVVKTEHALLPSRTLPKAQLAILPCGHGYYIGEICAHDPQSKLPLLVVEMIERFLGE